jgi:hypothetical protein
MDRFGRLHKHPTIVYQDGHWAFTRNLGEVLPQCGPVIRKYAGEISGRNDDSGVCPCSSDFFTKRNGLPRATATSTYNDGDVQETRRVERFTSGMDQRRALAMRKVYALPHRACQKWAHSSARQVCHMFLQSLQIYFYPKASIRRNICAMQRTNQDPRYRGERKWAGAHKFQVLSAVKQPLPLFKVAIVKVQEKDRSKQHWMQELA